MHINVIRFSSLAPLGGVCCTGTPLQERRIWFTVNYECWEKCFKAFTHHFRIYRWCALQFTIIFSWLYKKCSFLQRYLLTKEGCGLRRLHLHYPRLRLRHKVGLFLIFQRLQLLLLSRRSSVIHMTIINISIHWDVRGQHMQVPSIYPSTSLLEEGMFDKIQEI